MLERFGLCVAVTAAGPTLGDRLDAVEAAMDYQDGPTLYSLQYGQATGALQERVGAAAARLAAPGSGPTGRGPALSRRQVSTCVHAPAGLHGQLAACMLASLRTCAL